MSGYAIKGGWAFPTLSSCVPSRLCTRYTAFTRSNGLSFGHRKSFPLTTNCLSDMAVTIASDHNYGNKQVISVTPRIYDYLLTNVREPPVRQHLWSLPVFSYIHMIWLLECEWMKEIYVLYRFWKNLERRLQVCEGVKCR